MKQSMNYVTALPDFIEMQRASFCWFVAQGLNEELSMFSRIHDFSYNTEYILFGHEYSLVKPIYNTVRAKKYTANYSAQLVIPLEIRNKKLNTIRYHNQFPIINLPLMTTSATFIINGCERVIVSQIIRSPGIYFEKNKNQKKRKFIKRQLSTDLNKLKAFVPLGEPFISEQILSFFPKAYNQSIFQYSFNELKKNENNLYFCFLNSFKIYQTILKTTHSKKRFERLKIFLNWLSLKNKQLKIFYNNDETDLIHDWNQILRVIIKYQCLKQKFSQSPSLVEKNWRTLLEQKSYISNFTKKYNNLNTSDEQLLLLPYYKQSSEINFFNRLLPIVINSSVNLKQIYYFQF